MSPRWEAIALRSVRQDDIAHALDDRGIAWETVGHVTATRSLAGAIERHGDAAIPISTLIDFTVFAGMPADWRLEPPRLPRPTDDERRHARGSALDEWRHKVVGRTLAMDLRAQGTLRSLVRDGDIDQAIGRSLVAGRRQLIRGIRQLVAAGYSADHVRPGGDVVLAAAVSFWRALEDEEEAVAQVRRDLWPDRPGELRNDTSAAGLRQRLMTSLSSALGAWDTGRTLVHHGFHFYTPVQWALFRVLREVAEVDQVFVVHDDGETAVFQSWRRFFDRSLEMPGVPTPSGGRQPGPAAAALRDALAGERIDLSAASGKLDLYRSRNVGELARLMKILKVDAATNGRASPQVFAPEADDIGRSLRRLSGESSLDETSLGHLPVGTFLAGIHRCIGPDGTVTLDGDDLLDLASTGLLGLSIDDTESLAALRRALVFFRDCRDPGQWRERATALAVLVSTDVPNIEPRDRSTDAARIRSTVSNPLLRVPWLDISLEQAETIRQVVERVLSIVEQVTSEGKVRLREHLALIERYVRQELVSVSPDERARVDAQIEGLRTGLDEEVDVEALVDVVDVLLGRRMESDLLGDDVEPTTGVGQLLALDARGYAPLERDVHVANLSDAAFPSRTRGLSWPFRIEAVDPETGGLGLSTDILGTRTEVGAASDLYLLWLALDGVEGAARVQLSFTERLGGEPRNPSSVLTLLAEPQSATTALKARLGGLSIRRVPDQVSTASDRSLDTVALGGLSDADGVRRHLEATDHRALGAAAACPRRFVIQYLLGESAAFIADHHHAMLYGNVRAALITEHGLDPEEADDVCNRAWAHLTAGQRRSSLEKAVVRDSSAGGAGAHPTWTLTLWGSKDGVSPLDVAYRVAMSRPGPSRNGFVQGLARELSVADPGLLPRGVGASTAASDPEVVCNACPVRSRCGQRSFESS